MQRKHFKALAEAFSAVTPKGAEWRLCVERVAVACRQFNPAFNSGGATRCPHCSVWN